MRKKKWAKVLEEWDLVPMEKVVLVNMSITVSIYILLPFFCFSMVSSANTCPGYKEIKSFGFRSTFWRFTFFTLPKWVTFCGNVLRPPMSLISRPIVFGLGHLSIPKASQKSRSRGYIFSLPRFGCFSRSLRISSRILSFQILFLFFWGILFLGLRASGLFPPFSNLSF